MKDRLITVVLALVAGLAAAELRLAAVDEVTESYPVDTGAHEDIERRLVELEVATGAAGTEGPGPTLSAARALRSAEAVHAQSPDLAQAIAELDERVDARFEALAAKGSAPEPQDTRRKRLPLAEVAKLLDLTPAQHDDLKQLMVDTERQILDLVAGPGGSHDQVRADLERARKDPRSGRLHMMKYAPNVMQNADSILEIQESHDKAVVDLLGADTAKRLQDEYVVEEALVFGPPGPR